MSVQLGYHQIHEIFSRFQQAEPERAHPGEYRSRRGAPPLPGCRARAASGTARAQERSGGRSLPGAEGLLRDDRDGENRPQYVAARLEKLANRNQINAVGYQLLGQKRYQKAIAILKKRSSIPMHI